MARPLTGRLDPPGKGRRYYSLRVRVNGKQRRFDLGTADPVVADQRRQEQIEKIRAERAEGKRASAQRVRQGVARAAKNGQAFPAVAARFVREQESSGVKTWKEQERYLERFGA